MPKNTKRGLPKGGVAQRRSRRPPGRRRPPALGAGPPRGRGVWEGGGAAAQGDGRQRGRGVRDDSTRDVPERYQVFGRDGGCEQHQDSAEDPAGPRERRRGGAGAEGPGGRVPRERRTGLGGPVHQGGPVRVQQGGAQAGGGHVRTVPRGSACPDRPAGRGEGPVGVKGHRLGQACEGRLGGRHRFDKALPGDPGRARRGDSADPALLPEPHERGEGGRAEGRGGGLGAGPADRRRAGGGVVEPRARRGLPGLGEQGQGDGGGDDREAALRADGGRRRGRGLRDDHRGRQEHPVHIRFGVCRGRAAHGRARGPPTPQGIHGAERPAGRAAAVEGRGCGARPERARPGCPAAADDERAEPAPAAPARHEPAGRARGAAAAREGRGRPRLQEVEDEGHGRVIPDAHPGGRPPGHEHHRSPASRREV
mmetsp:Transcript_28440/g.80348  ORF Transcript_28440/g.80348 Transcript_28440/m.80348 type:complete len:424 (-) Transcript_28440:694-1965(-)